MRPNLGHVEDVPLVRLRILGLHHLHKDIPLGVVALLDSLEEVLGQEVGVFAGHLCGGLGVEVLGAALRLEVELDILEATVLCCIEINWSALEHDRLLMPAPCINKFQKGGRRGGEKSNLPLW